MQPLELPSALGAGLPMLRELSVYEDLMLVAAGSGITLQPGCLPPALRQLELFVHFLRVLPPVVTEATQLAQLRICYRGAPQMVLPGLSRLTNLRELVRAKGSGGVGSAAVWAHVRMAGVPAATVSW